MSDRSKRAFSRNRIISPFENLTEEFKKKQRAAIAKAVSKQVSQYSLKGKKIRTFKSQAEAQKITGVFATTIRLVATGELVSSGGYVWRYGTAKTVDINTVRNERRKLHRLKYGQKVTQYDFDGNRIAQFQSLQDAEAASGANANAIRLVLKGIYKSAKGFYWKAGFGAVKIDLANYKWGRQSMAVTQSKKVWQLSLKGKKIQIFPSINEAAKKIIIHPAGIIECCKGTQKTCGNYKWKYA